MLVIFIVVCFALIFLAGMHYAMWDNFGERKSLYFCLGMSVLGIYNLISLLGYVSRMHQ